MSNPPPEDTVSCTMLIIPLLLIFFASTFIVSFVLLVFGMFMAKENIVQILSGLGVMFGSAMMIKATLTVKEFMEQ